MEKKVTIIPSYSLFYVVWIVGMITLALGAGIVLPFIAGYVLAFASIATAAAVGRRGAGQLLGMLPGLIAGAYVGSVLADAWVALIFRSWDVLVYNALILFVLYFIALAVFLAKKWFGKPRRIGTQS